MSTATLTPDEITLIDLEADDILRCDMCHTAGAEWMLTSICRCHLVKYRCTACKENLRAFLAGCVRGVRCDFCGFHAWARPVVTLTDMFTVVQL